MLVELVDLEDKERLMTISQAETLKRQLTDKYVVVQDGVAELRRFQGLTGRVKTVNMSGRALVEFNGPVDIGWYDIDPLFLKIVEAPQPKPAGHAEKPAAEPKAEKAPKPAAAGKSPLEMARAQGAAGAGAKKPSPLEMARQQGAAKAGDAPAASAPAKKLSPLELARQQGAAKAGGAAPAASAPPSPPPVAPPPAPEPQVVAAPPAPPAAGSKPALAKPGSTAEIIALARQQGPFKG